MVFTMLLKNLWGKLMNNIKKYIKNIWTIMPMHTKKEKFYVSELKKHLNEYLDDHPQCSYDDIVQQFGEPKDIVVEYIQSSDENDLIKRMKLNKHGNEALKKWSNFSITIEGATAETQICWDTTGAGSTSANGRICLDNIVVRKN